MSFFSKPLLASLLLSLLLLHSAHAHAHADHPVASKGGEISATYHNKIDCGGACAARCRLSSRPRLCNRACGTCCHRCNCVPPGTSGNHHVCPCYASLTTHGGRPKCP